MLGMWGMNVPGRRFAGFESAFSEIAPRLVESGHEVVIYCRRGEYAPERRIPRHQGVRLVYLPSPGGKNLSAVVNTLFAVVHAVLVERFDLLFFVNVGMGHHCALARLLGQRVVLNVDGLDWTRDKWGRIAKAYFYSAAKMAVRVCTRLVTDAEAMRRFYLEHFGRDSTMIAYGTYVTGSTRPERVQELGLAPREYWLIVSRMIPENSLDTMLEAYVQSGSSRPLVVVGGATYDSPFHRRLQEIAARADGRIRFLGHVHDEELLRELWCNCFGYLHGHSVGGTNPALLNAMGYGSCILALDTVFNREVLGGTGLLFPAEPAALAAMLQSLEQDPARAAAMREPPRERVRAEYSWEKITRQYEELFLEVAR